MENWNPSVVYTVAIERHREKLERGEAAQRSAAQQGRRLIRAHLAAMLVALAARLAPVVPAAERLGAV